MGEEFITQLVEGFMKDIKSDLRARDMFVSGKSESLFEVKTILKSTSIEVQLWGPSYMRNLQTGRGPTTGGSSGGQTLQQALLEWIEMRGIRPDGITQESLSWAMAKHMHNEGNRGNSPSGKGRYAGNKMEDILEKVITESKIDEAVDKFASKRIEQIFVEINNVLR